MLKFAFSLLSLFLVGVSCAPLSLASPVNSSAPRKMKTILYQGGIVQFRIPEDWKEEYEKEGGGTFYSEEADSGTLRLKILTFKTPPKSLPKNGYEQLLKESKAGSEAITPLKDGNGMRRRQKNFEENGEKLLLYSWDIANVVPPNHYRQAIFTWTILQSQEKLPEFRQQIQEIENELKDLTFSPTLGDELVR